MRLQLLAEGRVEQGCVDLLRHLLQLRANVVKIFALGGVEFVLGVDGVADVGQRAHRVPLLGLLGVALKRVDLLLRAGRIGNLRRCILHCGLERRHIRPLIRHFGKFHCTFLLCIDLW